MNLLLLNISIFICFFTLSFAQVKSPVKLTDPDGADLHFLSWGVKIAVHGPIALVENEMIFYNPSHQQIEGRFSMLMPQGATISRFAMNNTGVLMEGEVVEKLKARAIYRQILHRRRDPALLEYNQANLFAIKIFPLNGRVTVKFILTYSVVLPRKSGIRELTVPFHGLNDAKLSVYIYALPTPGETVSVDSPIGDINLERESDGRLTASQDTMSPATPSHDLRLRFSIAGAPTLYDETSTSTTASTPVVTMSGNATVTTTSTAAPQTAALDEHVSVSLGAPLYIAKAPVSTIDKTMELFVSSVTLPADIVPTLPLKAGKENWLVYIDTSASTGDVFGRHAMIAEVLRQLSKVVPAGSTIRVVAFDLEVDVLNETQSMQSFDFEDLSQQLKRRLPLGMSDIGAAFKHMSANRVDNARYLFISDGIATHGTTNAATIQAAFDSAASAGPVFALTIGDKFDEIALKQLVAGRGRLVNMRVVRPESQALIDAAAPVVQKLREPIGQSIVLSLEDALWLEPSQFDDVKAGDELVFVQARKAATQTSLVPTFKRYNKDGSLTLVDATAVARVAKQDTQATRLSAVELLVGREAHHGVIKILERLHQAATSDSEREKLRLKIIEASEAYRILTPYTAFLVLEFEEQYGEYNINRTALADILVVTERGVGVLPRGDTNTRHWNEPAATTRNQETIVVEDDEDDFQMETLANSNFGDYDPVQEKAFANSHSSQIRPSWWLLAVFVVLMMFVSDVGAAGTWYNPHTPKPSTIAKIKKTYESDKFVREYTDAYVTNLIAMQQWDEVERVATDWLQWDSSNVAVYEALGRAAYARGDRKTARRAFTSIAEVAPTNSAYLKRAGWLLLTLVRKGRETADAVRDNTVDLQAASLALGMFRRAYKERQDDPNIIRGIALAQWMGEKHDDAIDTLDQARTVEFHDRYGNVSRVFSEEADLIHFDAELKAARGRIDNYHFRATMSWETDGNNLDMYVEQFNHNSYDDAVGGYRYKNGNLRFQGNVRDGLGPEVITFDARYVHDIFRVGVEAQWFGAYTKTRGVVVATMFSEVESVSRIVPQIIPFDLQTHNRLQLVSEFSPRVRTDGYRESHDAIQEGNYQQHFEYASE